MFHLISYFFPEKTPREAIAGNGYFAGCSCPSMSSERGWSLVGESGKPALSPLKCLGFLRGFKEMYL